MTGPADTTDAARAAAAAAAVDYVEPGTTIGLGSGRALWKTIELIAARWPEGPPVRAVCASDHTAQIASEAGIERAELDGETRLAVALDGADEVDPGLGLIKGGGAALLREKLVILAAERFVVVAESSKRVDRLGATRRLPVEVVRFGWRDTRRRLREIVPEAEMRTDGGDPVITDEGHHLLDCELPPEGDLGALAAALERTVGVVEHGLFLGLADVALLGRPDGGVDVVKPA